MFVLVLAANAISLAAPAITKEQIEADWLRQQELRALPAPVTVTNDAAGGCDGVVDGKWGFHTSHEQQPWWQVDLGQETAIDRLRLFNRCDSFAERNARCLVMLSTDGTSWTQAYQHDGTVFYGHSDSKPLEVNLSGAKARFVRIQLLGTDYLHLDEVEVYAVGSAENIALNRPATQSSISQWSAAHGASDNTFMSLDSLLKRA